MTEEYNEYGEIKPFEKKLSFYQEHRIHQTKDILDGNCSLCQEAIKKKVESYWGNDD